MATRRDARGRAGEKRDHALAAWEARSLARSALVHSRRALRGAAGPLDQKLGQQRHRTAGSPFAFAGHRVGASDVEMRPLVAAGEAAQEARRGDRARRTTAQVAHVRKVALELILIPV